MRCTHSSLLSCLCTGFRGYDEMCVWLVGRSGWVSELLTTNSRHRHLHLHHLHLGLAISLHGGTDSESHSCSLLYDCRRCTDGFVRQTVAARADIDLVLCLRAEDCRGGTTWMARELCERAGRQAGSRREHRRANVRLRHPCLLDSCCVTRAVHGSTSVAATGGVAGTGDAVIETTKTTAEAGAAGGGAVVVAATAPAWRAKRE